VWHQREEQLLDAMLPSVMLEMNNLLTDDFTAEEVKATLDAIGNLKVLGPDGMLIVFFKKHWDVVGEQLTKEVIEVLQGGQMPDGWNDTIISLILEVERPEKVTNLRPISLFNVIYKVVSKVLSNKLRQVLPDIITPNQSAFVPRRLILDNILS
jgi:hypothetical protein